jgi:hypothetical protein
MSDLSPMLVSSLVAMLLAGWNWSQATGYRRKKSRLDARERDLAGDLARVEAEGRMPRLFPVRVYELTYRMLEHAVHGEMADLVIINLAESADTCQLVVDQCVALADCILGSRSSSPWPPTDEDIRLIAAIAISGIAESGEKIAHTGPPAAGGDEAVYAYLARVVVGGEAATEVFPPGESVVLPVWATAAMLVSFLPGRPWGSHVWMIWGLETSDGVNHSALTAIESWGRRRRRRRRSAGEAE